MTARARGCHRHMALLLRAVLRRPRLRRPIRLQGATTNPDVRQAFGHRLIDGREYWLDVKNFRFLHTLFHLFDRELALTKVVGQLS